MFVVSQYKGKYNPPVGTIISFWRNDTKSSQTPNNLDSRDPNLNDSYWVECDGRFIGKFVYEDLFSVIGETYGSTPSNFAIPDYRNKIIVGNGPVDGDGTSYVGGLTEIDVGNIGGQYNVDSGLFSSEDYITIDNYQVSGWENLNRRVSTSISGDWIFSFGPLEDATLNGVPEHGHKLLASQVAPSTSVNALSVAVDPWSVCYLQSRANILEFSPIGGSALGHSHYLYRGTSLSRNTKSYGNVNGPGTQLNGNSGVRAVLEYSYDADDLSFRSSTITQQMSDFNDLDISHTFTNNFSSFSIYNKYKRVTYWIKII